MKFKFNDLIFEIKDKKITIKEYGCIKSKNAYSFVDCHIAGENRIHAMGTKILCGSEFFKMDYVSHEITNQQLTIIQESDKVRITTYFQKYEDTNAIRIFNKIKNISNDSIILEEFSIFSLVGLGKNGVDSTSSLSITKFIQSHHAECQARTNTFNELGLFRGNLNGQKVISGKNIGSWSTKEMLPMAIIEDKEDHSFFAFEIESNNSWYYEFADIEEELYFALSTCSLTNTGWYKKLEINEEYQSDCISICLGHSLNDVLKNLSIYRRKIRYHAKPDCELPIIFNEYMHFSWDNPNEKRTKELAPFVKELGVEYYVIDCGWHDDVESKDIYAHLGTWRESKTRFPKGMKHTIDYLHSLGLKVGLWIEPEMLGIKNESMFHYYHGNDSLLTRFKEPIVVRNRYFLDFQSPKVIDYLNETIRYMIEDLKVDYIKMDYNDDLGIGSDKYQTSFGEGLKNNANCYLNWVSELQKKYPNCLFESCASGGMRMDYKTLSHFSICSTSDQVFYNRYPYIVSNLFAAVLPEQAAVWAYPVASPLGFDETFVAQKEWVDENISSRQVIVNMVNALLGRIHLASNLSCLSEDKIKLVKDGLKVYNNLRDMKKTAVPYFVKGFCNFFDASCVSGLKNENTLYLSVYALKEKEAEFTIDEKIDSIQILYPCKPNANVLVKGNQINVSFEEICSACLLEIKCS